MQQLGQQALNQKKPPIQQNSAFANALLEHERPLGDAPANQPAQPDKNALFSEAMARAGGNFAPLPGQPATAQDAQPTGQAGFDQYSQAMNQQAEQQRMMEEQRKAQEKAALAKKLHDQINPVHSHDIFSARQEEVARTLNETRQEIKALAREIDKLNRDISLAVDQAIVEPGTDGAYYVSFLQKLRNFIMLLRQKVKSASAWAKQAQSKKAKQKRGKTPGLEIGGQQSEQTKTVFDMMHHERSTTYSGS